MDYNKWTDIPQDVRDKMLLAIGVVQPGRNTARIFCQSIDVSVTGILHCINVIADTSEMAQGIVIETKFSHQPWIEFGGQVSWTIRPISLEEREPESSHIHINEGRQQP